VCSLLPNRELSDSRSDVDGKRKSVESLPLQRNVRLSVRPFDDSDDMTVSHLDEDTETPFYSSGSVIWKSSSEAILDVVEPPSRQQRGSATDSCSSEHGPDSNGRRNSERDLVSSESSDVVLSSDCSLSSEQSPVHQTESDRPHLSTAVSAHVDPTPVRPDDVDSGDVNINVGVASRNVTETALDGPDGSHSLLDEINHHLKQTHGRELLPGSYPEMSGTAKRSPDDMSLLDIDTALAEVMSGLELLGRSRGLSLDHSSVDATVHSAVPSSSPPPSGRVASPRTPDLVVGLPQFAVLSATSPQPLEVARSPPSTTTGQLTSAEMFANVDRCTIKKIGPSTSAPNNAEVWSPPGHPLRVVDIPPPSAVGAGRVSFPEQPGWSPLSSFGGRRTQGSPARSQSCRAAERQSDLTWSTLWTTSSEMQRERELARSISPPQCLPAATGTSPTRNDAVVDRAELQRFPSSVGAAPWKDSESLSYGFIATLPRETTGGGGSGPKTPVKVKPPVMKKPVRSAEMMRRLSEYQQTQHQQ